MDFAALIESQRARVTAAERRRENEEMLAFYGRAFDPANIPDLSAEVFKSFLSIKNNKHWEGIHRQSGLLTRDMSRLRDALGILVDKEMPLRERLGQLFPKGQPGLVKGLGRAIATPILTVVHPEECGVFNSRSERALKHFGLFPNFERGASFADRYIAVNRVLNRLAHKYNLSLLELDEVLGRIPSDEHTEDFSDDEPVEIGDMLGSPDTASGRPVQAEQTNDVEGSVIQVEEETALGDSRKVPQYEVVLHWDGVSSLRGFDLAECDLSALELENADLSGANLRGADLSSANLSNANLRGADLREAKLSKAEMVGSDLSRADLRGADLCGADLGKANLSEAELHGANLSWAGLSGANLHEAKLSRADLSVTNLSRANLNMANLSGANLNAAYLGGANLDWANLCGAKLCGAYLGGARLGGAALRDAVLKEARVTDEQLAQAESLKGVTMPNGTKHE
jgi:uncharacterized protein YjbI with pentapeptide repeats